MRARAACALAASVAIAVTPAVARAEGHGASAASTEATPLAAGSIPPRYDVPSECPSRAEFDATLRERLPATLRAYALAGELAVSVRRREPGGEAAPRYAGELRALAVVPGEARLVEGASCAEVLEALTLIAALSLEQLALAEPAPFPPGPPPPGPSPTDRSPPEPASPVEPSVRRPALGPIAFVSWQNASAPSVSFDLGLGVVASFDEHPLSPWLLVGAYWGGSDEPSLPGLQQNARFDHFSSLIVACAWRLPQRGALAVRPCIDLDVGALRGEGRLVGSATRRTTLWLSTGAELRASITLGESVELGAQAAIVLPLWRPRFYFLPEITAFQVEAVGFRGGAFASARF